MSNQHQVPIDSFDGATVGQKDSLRLATQLNRVLHVLKLGGWWTCEEIQQKIEALTDGRVFDPLTSVSAQCRNLRKGKHGEYNVESQRREGTTIHEYKLVAGYLRKDSAPAFLQKNPYLEVHGEAVVLTKRLPYDEWCAINNFLIGQGYVKVHNMRWEKRT